MKRKLLVGIFFASLAFAHKGHQHGAAPAAPTAAPEKSAVQKVAESYAKNVQPIFEKKCMDCHSDKTVYPWYHSIPGIKQFIDSDIAEGREHIDFGGGYPFKSHATPLEDLDAIKEEVQEGDMPPLMYSLMHSGSKLTEDEKKVVVQWVDESLATLKQ